MTLGIKNIKSLRSFGIYKNHDNAGCDEFSKFNLVYGWNGSGKSTLSKLFRCIELKSLDSINYQAPTFSVDYCIEGDEAQSVTQANISLNTLNIATFNQDFIKDNIDWDKSVKSILLVDKKKIEERQQLELKKTESATKEAKLKVLNDGSKAADDEIAKFLTKTAKKVKTSLQVIGTEDRKYLNYNKTSLATLITNNTEAIYDTGSLLTDQQTIELTKAAEPIEMPTVHFSDKPIPQAFSDTYFKKLNQLFKKSVVNEVIQVLKDNPDIQTWVSTGMTLHDKNDSNLCHFCGSDIAKRRFESLNNHFSAEFIELKAELERASENGIEIPEITLPPVESFFPEFQDEYKAAIVAATSIADKINEITQKWSEHLEQKIANPFNIELVIEAIPSELIDAYNQVITSIQACVTKHNEKSTNFKAVTNEHKSTLELHYAAEEIIDFDYNTKITQKNTLTTKIIEKKTELTTLTQEIRELEQNLSNETIAAEQFNDDLSKFLGRTELALQFDPEQKGYKISRHGSDSHAESLSEGEKTAIAFVYFATKLTENDNDIKKTIVVVDDPVSSFDSNHLFHSYSFLKKHCEQAMQLFVLTHNFSYFKLVRDWILKKNKRGIIKSKAYTIECTIDGVRNSKLISAGDTLIKYGSEYHYLFSKLYSLKGQEQLNLDEVYLCANLSRKLLESFLSFKFPKKRGDFRQLVADGVKKFPVITEEETEKVYRFINKYSHNQEIDMGDSVDNLLGESPAILSIILNMIKVIDEVHYTEMEALVIA